MTTTTVQVRDGFIEWTDRGGLVNVGETWIITGDPDRSHLNVDSPSVIETDEGDHYVWRKIHTTYHETGAVSPLLDSDEVFGVAAEPVIAAFEHVIAAATDLSDPAVHAQLIREVSDGLAGRQRPGFRQWTVRVSVWNERTRSWFAADSETWDGSPLDQAEVAAGDVGVQVGDPVRLALLNEDGGEVLAVETEAR